MPRDREAPTVVIVHGAWAEATSWREVISLLHVEGLSVIAVQNPLSALADDVDAVTRAIDRRAVRSYLSVMDTVGLSSRRPELRALLH